MTEARPINDHGRQHGRVVSWAVVVVALAAFAVGGAALILGMWWLFYTCAGIFVLCVPAGYVIGIMDDTVQWTVPPSTLNQPHTRPK